MHSSCNRGQIIGALERSVAFLGSLIVVLAIVATYVEEIFTVAPPSRGTMSENVFSVVI